MSWLPAAITSPAGRALALLPVLPWWGWGIAAAGVTTILLGAKSAGGAEESGTPTRPGGPPPVLKLGSSGPWVRYLQSKLSIDVTGTFDVATGAAVKAFQAANGLTDDEIVGPATWGKLGVTGSAAPAPKPSAPSSTPAGPSSSDNPFGLAEDVPTRDGQILGYVEAGNYDHEWVPITWTKGGHTASVLVSRQPLAITGPGGRLIVNTTMPTAQKIADAIGGALLTTRVADEIHRQANAKFTFPEHDWNYVDKTGTKTFRMYDQSAIIDGLIAGRDGIASSGGKDWVLSRRTWQEPEKAHNAVNFGGYDTGTGHSPGGMKVAQSIGLAHNMLHTDYSQLLRFLRPDSLTIDGQSVGWAEALASPELSAVVQDEGGTIPSPRHPDL